ncbi:uncharacterized protein BDW47DRAFT_100148 [Aspergillus candidus]|uniref:Uncharacterized protein n=1 Tax=Aspergillus candidus TaxID=41067 RepID=A0A2I2FJW5_ASPCN|nr:hypothetical protein BDW47DRAFT_100148 [Aspergillus candidus]PLB40910.1 hypothetical protein BDW47DRAFT_100148 [Aspergillus candidus]
MIKGKCSRHWYLSTPSSNKYLPNPTRIQYPQQQPPAESNPSSETIPGLPGLQGRNRLVGRAKG